MDEIKKIVSKFFPELSGGYHLPHFATVVAVSEGIQSAQLNDESNPVYAVDVKILDINNNPDPDFPIFTMLPLPIPAAGNHRGLFGLPAVGSIVEVAFAKGSPSHPFIRSVLSHNVIVPALEGDEIRWNKNKEVYQNATSDGDWHRVTNRAIHDESNDLIERIESIADRLAKEKQLIRVQDGGKIWLGSESINLLGLISQTLDAVSSIASIAASHTHPSVGAVTTQALDFNTQSSTVQTIKNSVDSITE